MRLWHKDLISVLPRQQLLGQWRECCLIAKSISEKDTPGHLLVNKIMNYPVGDFWSYGIYVYQEMIRRGYKADFQRFSKWFDNDLVVLVSDNLFYDWHNYRYLQQCYYNLQEKYDCGGISDEEWQKIKGVIY